MPKMSISYTYQTLVPVVIKVTENEGECNENVGKKKKKKGHDKHIFNSSFSNVTVGQVLRVSTVFKCARDC